MQVLHHVDLRGYHTLAAPLFADSLLLIEHEDELADLPQDAMLIGGGSNVIFATDVQRPLAKLMTRGWQVQTEDDAHITVAVKGGENWHNFVLASVAAGWQGLENLALIPGTVGAAPVQNIGAYGVEAGQFIAGVRVYDRRERTFHEIDGQDCGFAYRHSHFKGKWRERYVIVEVYFRLNKKAQLCLAYAGLADKDLRSAQQVCEAVIAIRQSRLPDPQDFPNAGSFFHNPVVDAAQVEALRRSYPDMPAHAVANGMKIPAAWLIEQAGLKGFRDGKVGISPQHALVLINHGGSGRDILQFAALVQDRVRERFAISLCIEPIIIGEAIDAA